MNSSPASVPPESDWQPVPAGTLSAARHRLRRKAFLRQATKVGTAAVLMLAVGLGSWMLVPPSVESLTCEQVHGLARDYVNGRLDRTQTLAVEQHLESCQSCPPLIAQLRQTVAALWPARVSRESQSELDRSQYVSVVALASRDAS